MCERERERVYMGVHACLSTFVPHYYDSYPTALFVYYSHCMSGSGDRTHYFSLPFSSKTYLTFPLSGFQ